MNDKKDKILIIISMIIVLLLVTGLSYAFFASQNGGISNNDIIITSNTTDLLTFQIDNDIEFEVSQSDFVSGGNNKSGYTNTRAILIPNNKTGSATMNYYMYLNITENEIDYSSTNTDELPELMLQVFDGNNQLVTLSGLGAQETVKGVTGYDITGIEGLIPLLDNQEIVATNNIRTIQEWKVVITLINHDFNQNDNTGKVVEAEIIMRKDGMSGDILPIGRLDVTLTNNHLIREYRGEGYYHDETDKDTEHPFFTKPIYYWDGTTSSNRSEILNNWNVVFANSCWKMIRTTETGGVKLLYNGEPTFGIDVETGKRTYDCSTNRSKDNIKIGSRSSVLFEGKYYYGTEFEWDRSTLLYKLKSVDEEPKIMSNDHQNLIGKFTCKSDKIDGTCSTLYYIDEYISGYNAYAISLGRHAKRERITDDLNYAKNDNSIGYVGFMYNSIYSSSSATVLTTQTTILSSSATINTRTTVTNTHYYASSYDYDITNANKYTLGNDADTASNWKETTECDGTYSCLVGKYTMLSTSNNGSTLYYIVGVSGSYIYYVSVKNGENPLTLNNQYIIGTTLTDNNNGYYTINDSVTINRFDWVTNNASYLNHYICDNPVGSTCAYSDLRLISSTNNYSYNYYYSNNSTIKLSTSVTNNGSNYTLNNPVTISIFPTTNYEYSWYTGHSNFKNYYTCFDTNNTCQASSIVYILKTESTSATKYSKYNFTNSYTYDDTTGYYTLDMSDSNAVNTIDNASTVFDDVKRAHYYCIDSNGSLLVDTNYCNYVGYFIYNHPSYSDPVMYYYKLTGGKYVSTDTTSTSGSTKWADENNIIYAMLYSDNVNTNDSVAKSMLELWYKVKLLPYDNYIDQEEIYCNDRRIGNDFGSINLNAPNMSTEFKFVNYTANGNINCPVKVDSFSVNETTYANGALTYPIALPSMSEIYMITESTSGTALWSISATNGQTEDYFSTLTPGRLLNQTRTQTYNIDRYGGLEVKRINGYKTNYLVPSIALTREALDYFQGDGSATNPYLVNVGHTISLDNLSYKIDRNISIPGNKIVIEHSKYIVGSFKLNGTEVIGNSFIMPDEDVEITDINVYKVKNNTNNDSVILPNSAIPGKSIVIKSSINNQRVTSFKLNGTTITGNTFTMPQDNVIITDIVVEDILAALRNNPDYQIVDYIEGNGTQYINTGYKPNKDTGIEVEYQFNSTAVQQRVFGVTTSSETNVTYVFYINGSRQWAYGSKNGEGQWKSTNIAVDTNKHILQFNKENTGKMFISNTSMTEETNISQMPTLGESTLDIYILAENNQGTTIKYGNARIYYFKIYEAGELLKYFVPVVQISSGNAGLYDVVNDVFYTNQGTGTFTVPS